LKFDYSGHESAQDIFFSILKVIGSNANYCVLDNGWGVLLKVKDVLEARKLIPRGDWRRESFPELPGSPTVA
jgi:hypothetical protein